MTRRHTRDTRIQRISQAHLAPGMSLERWQEILARHGVGQSWDAVSNQTIDAIIAEISAVVKGATHA